MALAEFVPEIWSGRVLARLNDASVFRNVATTEFEGDISQFGDVVRINEIGRINVNAYSDTSTGALTIQTLADASKRLEINRQYYTAFFLDDVDGAQTKPKLMMSYMDQSAADLADEEDAYLATLYSDAGLAVGGTYAVPVAVSSTNVMKYLSIAQQKLDESNTPMQGRWIVVPPWFAQKMSLANIVLNTDNKPTMGSGYIGSTFYGFNVFMSNNVYHKTPATNAGGAILCGYTGSIAVANQISSMQQVPSTTIGFKTLVKMLHVYGAKVIRPNNLGVLWATYTAEAT